MRKLAIHLSLFAAACVSIASVWAEAYPSRPIVLIEPWPPGGTADTVGRHVSKNLADALPATIVIDNRAGAGGTLGATVAAKAKADGYTLVQLSSHHAIAQSVYTKPGYDLNKNFIPIARLIEVPNVLVVRKGLPVNSVKELIALAKAKPGQLTFGSAGNGSGQHLAGETFKQAAGIDLLHIPYKGAGPAMQDLMAGRIDIMFDGAVAAVEASKQGLVKALAVTTLSRPPSMPDLPTMDEAGVPKFESYTWHGLYAPIGTPPEVVERLNVAVNKAFEEPGIRKRWEEYGAVVNIGSPQDLQKLTSIEVDKWQKIVATLGLKID